MSRHPRDPRDPFNDRHGSPWGDFDPFNDPFFKQFEQIHDHIFRDFFGDDIRSMPSIFIEHPNSQQTPNGNNKSPDLSQINPNAPPSKSKNNDNYSNKNSPPSLLRMFKHFFEPEYDDHKLSDINPNLSDNGPIMNNDNDNKGLIYPDGAPPGFRSPYLPNWNGAEKKMEFENNIPNHSGPKSFYRSQSVVISTGPDGKTRKTTTIRDSNGESTTTTEEYDANNMNNNNDYDKHSIFNWNYNDTDNKHPPLFERTHDPFERFRSKWQNWKWNPYNYWYGKNGNDESKQNRGHSGQHNNEWFWKHKNNDNNNNSNGNEGIKWRSYRDYQSNHKRPSLLDDIVKKDDE